jgi:mRNA interferase MazF
MVRPARGEVWLADLDPVRGHEQAGRRPVLVVSENAYNRGPAELAIVLPLTSRLRSIAIHVQVHPPEGGLRVESRILCDAVRSVSLERFGPRLGAVSAATMEAVEEKLRILMRL